MAGESLKESFRCDTDETIMSVELFGSVFIIRTTKRLLSIPLTEVI